MMNKRHKQLRKLSMRIKIKNNCLNIGSLFPKALSFKNKK